ncbi:hypothetical protein N7510_006497 [Penicillium lagena]|uniref:uncharacterized protein n=1 Tax=Penicillium lagena TaxID=94218 RepID=UPI0025416D1B|nr:uncharacterized protein N7510_006497 [Penicillium lagena]KAJ5613303.1 hypothetical protein N7510_006497 [Penicillium lagena]
MYGTCEIVVGLYHIRGHLKTGTIRHTPPGGLMSSAGSPYAAMCVAKSIGFRSCQPSTKGRCGSDRHLARSYCAERLEYNRSTVPSSFPSETQNLQDDCAKVLAIDDDELENHIADLQASHSSYIAGTIYGYEITERANQVK